MEYRHAVRHGQRLALVMRDEHDGNAQRLLQMLDFNLHPLPQLLVQRAKRFVHQYEFRLKHQRARQRHALLLATRELRGFTVFETLQPHHGQRLGHPCLRRCPTHAAIAQRERDVLGDVHVRKQRVILEHEADIALFRRQRLHRLAVEQNMPGGGPLEAAQHHQRGGLARPGRAEQRKKLPAPDPQVQFPHHQRVAVVGFLDPVENNKVLRPGGRGHRSGGSHRRITGRARW